MALEPLNIVLLIATGIAAGAIATLIGGASLVAFPALIALGLTPIEAAISLNVALMPSGFAAAYYDRTKLPELETSLRSLIVYSTLCAALGALFLLWTPLETFKLLVPLLLALATLLFACAGTVSRYFETLGAHGNVEDSRWRTATWGMLPVGFYAGYFGAGVGVLFLSVLSVGSKGDYRVANSVKNLLVGLTSGIATAVYALLGAVIWPVATFLIVGTLLGAWLGTSIAKVAPREVMRVAIIIISVILTAVYTYRFWIIPYLQLSTQT